jgi:hypothetical protein
MPDVRGLNASRPHAMLVKLPKIAHLGIRVFPKGL